MKSLANQNGVVLVVTLAVISVLMITAIQVSRIVRKSAISGSKEKNRFYARQTALSGIEFAKLILEQDAQKNQIDSVQEFWADPLWMVRAVEKLGYAENALTITISDELSRLQVNALLKEFPGSEINPDQLWIWERLFKVMLEGNETIEDKDPAQFTNSIKDWMDSLDDDAVTGLSGAESDYYQALDPPYACANGPFNHVSELFSVKGITPDLFTKPLDKDMQEIIETVSPQIQMDQLITVHGLDDEFARGTKFRYTGKVNINTAPFEVLAALLPEGMEMFAQELVDYRLQKDEQGNDFINTLDKGWYKRVIELPDKEKERFEKMIGYASHLFRVECTALENSEKIILVAVLKREQHKISGKWICRTIQMERKY
ncbi:MAG: general secretion pathway protein GspK [Proteobacteria bacterium]|nr:general secretion pathway protein GspK [Pseudomonadota bacterium]MBU1388658.1 general secretion pathway protein GspK [Pseudomonadota bacterium]MBU2479459.1 general secretion pathway protein GspK [Pseudomonadota bacterium]